MAPIPMDATTNGDIKTTSPSGSSNDDCIGIIIEAGRARASAAIEARSAGRTVTGAASSIAACASANEDEPPAYN